MYRLSCSAAPVRRFFQCALLLLLLPVFSGMASQVLPFDQQAIIDRLRSLQNVTAVAEQTTTYTPPAGTPIETRMEIAGRTVKGRTVTGSRGYHVVFRFLDGRAYYEQEMDDQTIARLQKLGPPLPPWRYIRAYSRDRDESLTQHTKDSGALGSLLDHADLPADASIDVALGLRWLNQHGWLTPDALGKAKVSRNADGKVLAALAQGDIRWHTWVFDPAQHYALLSYTVSSRGIRVHELTCSDFRRVGELQLPYHMLDRSLDSRNQETRALREIRITKYVLNDPANTPGSFHIAFAQGSRVGDPRVGVSIRLPTTRAVSDEETRTKARLLQDPLFLGIVETLRTFPSDIGTLLSIIASGFVVGM